MPQLRCIVLTLACLAFGATTAAAEPTVSVWYRGSPAGQPDSDDLARIRARGFSAITWPSAYSSGLAELRRRAATVDLQVFVAADAGAAAAEPIIRRPGRLELRVRQLDASQLPAETWKAIAEDVQTIVFDPGDAEGTAGLSLAWVDTAIQLARQVSANAAVFEELEPASPLQFETTLPSGVRVGLFETLRSWVIIATNTTASSAHVVARLPADVPYAIWVSLVDASTVAMLDQPAGPRWAFDIAAGGARVYLIDKKR